MEICFEFLIRFILTLAKLFIENWSWILLAFGILVGLNVLFGILKLSSGTIAVITGAVASGVNMFVDLTVGGLGIGGIVGAFIGGMLFMAMISESKANSTLKIFAMPIFFVFGMLWVLLPLPIPGIEVAIGWVLNKSDIVANLIAAVLLILVLALVIMTILGYIAFSPDALTGLNNWCSAMNYLLQLGT